MRKVIPPTGYVERAAWAERLLKYGAKQRQCPVCRLWFFKCEKHQCSPNKPSGNPHG